MKWATRADGTCPRCKTRPVIERPAGGYYAHAEELAKLLDTELPPPLCEECLQAFRDAVTAKCIADCVHDQEAWDFLRDGRISVDEFFARVRDVGLYRDSARRIEAKRTGKTVH